jgi:glycosyltransferase involved in cell wall biosynthesis
MPVERQGLSVLQIPEVCDWNPYVKLAEQHLSARGVTVLRPGLCLDSPHAQITSPPEISSTPSIVHLHWPEMLAHCYGTARALSIVRDLVARGARLVQTVHDLKAHEPNPELTAYLHEVDALTSGVHFFSEEHERQARSTRPKLPEQRTHFLHPAFPALTLPAKTALARDTRTPGRPIVLGCLGRIRPYKRFLEFGHAFGQTARSGFHLLIAGAAQTSEIHEQLQDLERSYPSITYRPGFLTEEEFAEVLDLMDWVSLPYEQVFSSGVLVAAVQARKSILSPRPTGLDAYQLGASLHVVDPWDDTTAVRQWMDVALEHRLVTPPSVLPDWSHAAEHLIDFYHAVIEQPSMEALTRVSGAA